LIGAVIPGIRGRGSGEMDGLSKSSQSGRRRPVTVALGAGLLAAGRGVAADRTARVCAGKELLRVPSSGGLGATPSRRAGAMLCDGRRVFR